MAVYKAASPEIFTRWEIVKNIYDGFIIVIGFITFRGYIP